MENKYEAQQAPMENVLAGGDIINTVAKTGPAHESIINEINALSNAMGELDHTVDQMRDGNVPMQSRERDMVDASAVSLKQCIDCEPDRIRALTEEVLSHSAALREMFL